jgi:hypothetical protein
MQAQKDEYPQITYRRMGKIALTAVTILAVTPFVVTGIVLTIAQRYESLRDSGLLAMSASYDADPTHLPLQEVYDARYGIIGVVFLLCWILIPIITTLSTNPTPKKEIK